MKAAFITLGCKTNTYDTQAMMKILKDVGYEIVDFTALADVYVINTCAVTNISEAKSRQAIRRAVKQNPGAVIIAAGCYSQLNPDKLIKIPGIDAVIGNKDRGKLNEIIKNAKSQKSVNVSDISKETVFEPLSVENFEQKTRAYIKIQEGCDSFCAYCIIPYARGPARSRDIDDIVREVNNIVSHGHKEIVLTGIHIASYGKDKKNVTLLDLLKKLENTENLKRIRLGSLEPKIMTDEFLYDLSKLKKLCPSFHLSLQSGCDKTLINMNRKYNSDEYLQAVKRARLYFPKCSITTDIIVGFPMETDEDFESSYDFCRKIKFMKMHIFPFSLKKGTAAEFYNPKIDKNIILQRSRKFISLSDEMQDEYNRSHIGKTCEVLFEKQKQNINEGYTDNYIYVKVKYDESLEGQVQKVVLKENHTHFMTAEVLK